MGRKRERVFDIHHRLPRSQKGSNHPSNLSRVEVGAHRAWHRLFQNFMPITIAGIMNTTWIPIEWRMIAIPASEFLAVSQVVIWLAALARGSKRENMDGDGI